MQATYHHYSTPRYSTPRYSTPRYSTPRYSTPRYSTPTPPTLTWSPCHSLPSLLQYVEYGRHSMLPPSVAAASSHFGGEVTPVSTTGGWVKRVLRRCVHPPLPSLPLPFRVSSMSYRRSPVAPLHHSCPTTRPSPRAVPPPHPSTPLAVSAWPTHTAGCWVTVSVCVCVRMCVCRLWQGLSYRVTSAWAERCKSLNVIDIAFNS